MPTVPRLSALAAAVAVALSGCGSEDSTDTPSACLADRDRYVSALSEAPQEVTLEGGVAISDCLPSEQSGPQLAAVGREMIGAATDLNRQAREDPSGSAAVQLGYLVGAVERGADGIHADLVRRLSSAARFSPEGMGILPAEFERTFGRGYAAGLESG